MKECIAMLLAGGQGSRLYALTKKLAKPAVPFGGKYRIIDFPLSNCVNSGIDTVGILTQYQPLLLNEYIGNGQPWDLDLSLIHISSTSFVAAKRMGTPAASAWSSTMCASEWMQRCTCLLYTSRCV